MFVRGEAQPEAGTPRGGYGNGESPGHAETSERREERRGDEPFPRKAKGTRGLARMQGRKEGHGNLLSEMGITPLSRLPGRSLNDSPDKVNA